MMRRHFAIAPVALALLMTGCAIGPDYQRPVMELPDSYGTPAGSPELRISRDWWTQFNDPALNALEDRALNYNRDLAAAVARIEQAQAQLTSATADLLPQLNAGADATRGRNSLYSSTTGTNPVMDSYQASLAASFELDLRGKLRRNREAALASLRASEAARDTVALSVTSSVADAYFQLRTYDEQLDISRRTLKSREEALQIYAKRYHGGLISELDYRQAEAETATARVAVPRYEQAVSQAETALKVLVGANPREVFEAEVPRGEELSQIVVPPVLPDGTPSTLLLARPDLVSAEQQLVAANARIGVARAAYFPSISLTGAVGSASLALGELFTGPAALWNYGGALAMPVFNWGKTGAGVKAATAQQKEALANYELAVQNAFRDTRDALTAQQKSAEQLAAQDTQVNALQRTAHLARLRYENGYSSYLDVLDAERSLFSSELDRANARLARLNAAVSVYRALGGGYDQPGAREIPPPVLVQ